jgi:1-acyl-sn-glycerol-3-phosphate acyltransferase
LRSLSLRLLREARASLRIARVALHLAGGLATVLALYPLLAHGARAAVSRRWSAALLQMLGVQLRLGGAPVPNGALLVANHVSWLDVLVVNSVCPATFVSKHEVGDWPAVGLLLARSGTILLRRGCGRAAKKAVDAIGALLSAGRTVAIFPEGTTSNGSHVLPFRPALFQAAVDQQRAVQPLTLSYHDARGEPCRAAPFIGETHFLQSLRRIALAPRIVARVRILPAQSARPAPAQSARGLARRRLAARCRRLILEQLCGQQQPAAAPELAPRAVARRLGVPVRLGAVQHLLEVTEPGGGLAHVGLEAGNDAAVEQPQRASA